ncbi:MAG: hypothetical protein ACOYXT_19055 [Bacteroidota bacterium]
MIEKNSTVDTVDKPGRKSLQSANANIVANFKQLIGFCAAYGTAYSPSEDHLTLDVLYAQHRMAEDVMAALALAKTAYNNATNAREEAFEPLKKLATKMVNALAATKASKLTIDDAISVNRKIQGRRAGSKSKVNPAETSEPASVSNSVSQQGFDTLLDNFAKLVQTLSAEPRYKPNEPELQVKSLNALLTDLKNKNDEVIHASVNLSNVRIERNTILYAPETGVYDVAMAIKKYVKSIFGAKSPQFAQVSAVKFFSR